MKIVHTESCNCSNSNCDGLSCELSRPKSKKRQTGGRKRLVAATRAIIAERSMAAAHRRHLRVLRSLCQGMRPKQVARAEKLSLEAVFYSIARLRFLSGAKSREQMGVWAVLKGHYKP